VLPLCYEENPRIYLEKSPENDKKTDIQNVVKNSNSNLKCTLPVVAHKKSRYYALFASSFQQSSRLF